MRGSEPGGIVDDIRTAARAIRGSSWPMDMAERMDKRADRLEAYADELEAAAAAPVGGGEPGDEELRREVAQLRYERKLLGSARMTLDALANGRDVRAEAAQLADAIVDEIGHPVTDADPKPLLTRSAAPLGTDPFDVGWGEGARSLMVLTEPQRLSARTVVADLFDGDFNLADTIVGTLHREGFEVVNADAVFVAPSAAPAIESLPAAVGGGVEAEPPSLATTMTLMEAWSRGYCVGRSEPRWPAPTPAAVPLDEPGERHDSMCEAAKAGGVCCCGPRSRDTGSATYAWHHAPAAAPVEDAQEPPVEERCRVWMGTYIGYCGLPRDNVWHGPHGHPFMPPTARPETEVER